MIEKSFGLIYVLRPTRKGGNEKALFARITVDGIDKEISLKRNWDAKRWCQRSYTATGNREDARELNNFVQTFTMKVHQARKYLMDTDDVITVEKIKNIIVDTAGKQHFLLKEFDAYNERLKSLIGTDYRPRTVQRYVTTRNHLAEFVRSKFGRDDVPLTYITESFVADLEHWFKSEKKNIHNSTVKNLGNFRKMLAYCRKQKWLKIDPFTQTNMTLKQTKIVPLNATELYVLSNKPLATERLSVIRDVFVFSCYTGLSYSDVERLTYTDIIIGVDGQPWINIFRTKTEGHTRVPLLPAALDILRKYEYHPGRIKKGTAMLIPSNQKVNEYLKELATVCSINKHLTFHIARHTFATTVTLANGVPLNTVSKMLGHKTIKHTEHYAKLVDNVISDDMSKLREKLENSRGISLLPPHQTSKVHGG